MASTVIFGVWHSNFLEVNTKIEIHNNGLSEGKIISNFHCSIVPMGTFEVNIASYGLWSGHISFFRGGEIGQCNIAYRTHVALWYGCSIPAAE